MSDSTSDSVGAPAGTSPAAPVGAPGAEASTSATPSPGATAVAPAPTAAPAQAPAPVPTKALKPMHSAACAVSLALGIAYVAYFVWSFFVKADGTGLFRWVVDMLDLASGIKNDYARQLLTVEMGVIGLVYVHFALTVIGLFFNLLAATVNRAGLALTAALFYALAALFFCIYLPFVLPELMLCCAAFGSMRERQKRYLAARRAAGW